MKEILDEQKPPKWIYKEGAIVGASFLGGPMAGAYMMAQNFKAFNEADKAKNTLIAAAVVMVLLIVGAVFLPDSYNTLFSVFPIACTITVSRLVHSYQGEKIKKHIKDDGPAYSGWRAVWIALICVAIVIAAIVTIAAVTDNWDVFS